MERPSLNHSNSSSKKKSVLIPRLDLSKTVQPDQSARELPNLFNHSIVESSFVSCSFDEASGSIVNISKSNFVDDESPKHKPQSSVTNDCMNLIVASSGSELSNENKKLTEKSISNHTQSQDQTTSIEPELQSKNNPFLLGPDEVKL